MNPANQGQAGLCLIEDDAIMGESLSRFFELEDIPCDWHRSLGEARYALDRTRYCMLISDIRLPDGDGGEFYKELAASNSTLPPTLFITGYGSVEQAVSLLKQGAQDYVTKPFDPNDLLIKLRRLCPALFDKETHSDQILGVSSAMQRAQQILQQVSEYQLPVLITGESGVGKEYAARYLHECRFGGEQSPFVALNCAAVPADLIEAELFGVEHGAFTGSVSRAGLFEQAQHGTLFLDEVGDMPLDMQAKLLRATQEKRIRRVGGSKDIEVDCQLVWATNRNLEEMIQQKRFREDLYFRMSAVQVDIPPLRKRPDDIAWFARRFLESFSREIHKRAVLSKAAMHYLQQYPWPGNVRELRQCIERAVIFSRGGILEPGDFQSPQIPAPRLDEQLLPLRDYLQDCERWYILETIQQCHGRIGDAANKLGISRKNLWERMTRLDISNDEKKRSRPSLDS